MSKINEWTREHVDYFESGCKGNTMVTWANKEVSVYLHANFIYKDNGDCEVFTLHGWNTNTTRSRLNAILTKGQIVQRDYMPYLVVDGKKYAIDVNKYYKLANGKWFEGDSNSYFFDRDWSPLV